MTTQQQLWCGQSEMTAHTRSHVCPCPGDFQIFNWTFKDKLTDQVMYTVSDNNTHHHAVMKGTMHITVLFQQMLLCLCYFNKCCGKQQGIEAPAREVVKDQLIFNAVA